MEADYVKIYELESDGEHIRLEYHGGLLSGVEIGHVESNYLLELIRFRSEDLEDEVLRHKDILLRRVKIKSSKEKIALWCDLYKEFFGVRYKVSQAEAGMVRHVPFERDLILYFFSLSKKEAWWSETKTISNYVKRNNELRRLYSTVGGRSSSDSELQELGAAFQRRYKAQAR